MQKPNLAAILLTTLIATALFTAAFAFAAVSVGVKILLTIFHMHHGALGYLRRDSFWESIKISPNTYAN